MKSECVALWKNLQIKSIFGCRVLTWFSVAKFIAKKLTITKQNSSSSIAYGRFIRDGQLHDSLYVPTNLVVQTTSCPNLRTFWYTIFMSWFLAMPSLRKFHFKIL